MATILVVDDNPTNRKVLTTLLGYQGHRLVEAADGEEALALARAERPDLVITDVIMPSMDGYEFVRQLRTDPAVAETPVVFYTALSQEEKARALARVCGVKHVLSKPSVPKVILQTVGEALGSTPPPVVHGDPELFDRDHLRLVADELARRVQQLEEEIERRKATEEALRESHERQRAIFDSMFPFVGLLSLDGVVVEANRPPLEAAGLRWEDVIGKQCAETYWFSYSPAVQAELRDALARAARGEVVRYDTTIRVGDDRFLVIDLMFGPLRDAHGEITQVVGSAVDITARKRAEEALTKSEASLAAAQSQAKLGNWELSFATQTAKWSAEMFRIHRRDPSLGPPTVGEVFESVHADDRKSVESVYARVVRDGSGGSLDYRVVRPDGSIVWAESQWEMLFDETGQPVGLVGTLQDITDRKRAEEALRESEAQLATDLDAMTRLQKVGTLFVQHGALQQVLDEVLAAALAITNTDMGNIQLLDGPSGCLRIVAQRGFEKPFLDFWNTVHEGEGTCGTAMKEGRRVFIEDVTQSAVFAGKPALDVMLRAGVRAVQSTRLQSRSGRLLGMFSTHFRTPHRPDERTLRLLDLLAQQTSDILDRAESEETLRDSEQRLRQAASAGNVGLWDWDLLNNKVSYSREWKRQIGYEEHEITNDFNEWQSRVHPEDLEPTLAIVRDYLANRYPQYHVEFRFRHKDGSYRWILAEGSLIYDAAGHAVRMMGSHVDITDRKRAEQTLAMNERRFRALVEHGWDWVSVADADGTCRYVSPAGLRSFGYDQHELLGRVPLDLVHADDLEEMVAAYRQLLQSPGGQIHLCHRFRHKTQGWRWIDVAATNLLADPAVDGLVMNYRDITERKQAEDALRESEEQLRLALDAAHMGTFDWDVPHNRITWSRWHEELWGFAPGEFAGTYEAFAERVHPDDLPDVNAEIARCMAAREPFAWEFRVVWPDDSVHWIAAQGEFTYGADGRPLRMHGVVVETTARKRAEEQLAASRDRLGVLSRQLLEAQETERRHLARELHDEIGQVLTLIKIKATVARRHVTGEGQAGLDELVSVVETTIQQVRNLSLDLRPSILDDFGLEAALEWFVDRQGRGTQIAVSLDSDLGEERFPPEIETAGFRIVQEAITNALRHARAGHVRVESRRGGKELQLAIADDGIGFEVDEARQRAIRGGSVGLLGMQERAELLDGRFSLTSTPGRGTKVAVQFPLSGPTVTPDRESAGDCEDDPGVGRPGIPSGGAP